MFTFSQLATIASGTVLQLAQEYPLQHLLTDSRRLTKPAGTVFFAIKGRWNNGHDYIPALYRQGVRQFVVEQLQEVPGVQGAETLQQVFPEANFLEVKSALQALQAVAAQHRQQFRLPVIGITGSNGKTIVKEWLAQLLSPDFLVVKSPRSYNSQIGVPLSVWEIQEQHTLGIFEAGISRPGEMEKLEKIIKPDFGIFTNIGSAHAEGFASQEQKVAEKLKLFEHCKCLFYCADHTLIHEQVQEKQLKSFTWSRRQEADVQVLSEEKLGNRMQLTYLFEGKAETVQLPFTDAASVENAIHCLVQLLFWQVPAQEAAQRLAKLQPIAMRLEMKEAINGCYIIDDTYNNDLGGLTIALNLLTNQPRHQQKTLILSDLLEAGMDEAALYNHVAALVNERQLNRFIGIGSTIGRYRHNFAGNTEFYESTEAFLDRFSQNSFKNETILVKGARVFGFEKIVAAFQQKVHGTVLEVNLDALVHNLNFYRFRLKPQTKVMVMVKAFAYGSGSYEIANLLQFHRVDYLAVAYTDEGVALREHGITLPIMVMNPSPDSFAKLQQYHLEPEIYSPELLRAFLNFNNNTNQHLHLKLDTGMHRLGFTPEDLPEVAQLLRERPELRVVSMFSHLAGADEACHNDFSQQQIQQFKQMAAQLEQGLGYPVLKHILNSAGIIRFPEEQQDMVRLGIGLYGVEASGKEQDALRVVGTLKTTVSQVKQVQKGETVGYSRRGIASEAKTIATLAIGYADGYDRRFGNGVGQVLVRGQLAPIIGNVCMDMCMADITGITGVKAGDEVVVYGEQPNIKALAQAIGTIPYELLTNVSARVKRVFYSE